MFIKKNMNDNFIIRSCVPGGYNRHNYPIELKIGNQSPQYSGESYYYTTPSGKTIIRHPSAYRWPKVYHNSTQRITVGQQWVDKCQNRQVLNDGTIIFIDTKQSKYGFNIFEGCINNEGCWYITRNNRSYHINKNFVTNILPIKDLIKQTIIAWKKQDKIDQAHILLNKEPHKIWVSIQDSIECGNCVSMTHNFAKEIASKFDITYNKIEELGAVRADTLLSIRNDLYTQRACKLAALRTIG
jgi:hypothetical protein